MKEATIKKQYKEYLETIKNPLPYEQFKELYKPGKLTQDDWEWAHNILKIYSEKKDGSKNSKKQR